MSVFSDKLAGWLVAGAFSGEPTDGSLWVYDSTQNRWEIRDTVRSTSGGNIEFLSGTAFVGTFDHAITAARTWTFPDITDTVVVLTGTQTLTNKTINLTSNTLTGTTAQFNTALSDNDFATLAGAETLTNKTLTSPTIQGTVGAGTGLTMPAFTSGAIDMANALISNIGAAGTDFTAGGGLTLAAALTVSAGGVDVTAGGVRVSGLPTNPTGEPSGGASGHGRINIHGGSGAAVVDLVFWRAGVRTGNIGFSDNPTAITIAGITMAAGDLLFKAGDSSADAFFDNSDSGRLILGGGITSGASTNTFTSAVGTTINMFSTADQSPRFFWRTNSVDRFSLVGDSVAFRLFAGDNATELWRTVQATGNFKLAGTATRATTEGTNHLDIFNGTAPVGTLTNGISLYSAAGELNVIDAGGTVTLLSPHDAETGEWIYRSKALDGRVLRVDMERMVRALNQHFGWNFIHEETT